jgi:hypothetical protein
VSRAKEVFAYGSYLKVIDRAKPAGLTCGSLLLFLPPQSVPGEFSMAEPVKLVCQEGTIVSVSVKDERGKGLNKAAQHWCGQA